jgi:hypothetical protein
MQGVAPVYNRLDRPRTPEAGAHSYRESRLNLIEPSPTPESDIIRWNLGALPFTFPRLAPMALPGLKFVTDVSIGSVGDAHRPLLYGHVLFFTRPLTLVFDTDMTFLSFNYAGEGFHDVVSWQARDASGKTVIAGSGAESDPSGGAIRGGVAVIKGGTFRSVIIDTTYEHWNGFALCQLASITA